MTPNRLQRDIIRAVMNGRLGLSIVAGPAAGKSESPLLTARHLAKLTANATMLIVVANPNLRRDLRRRGRELFGRAARWDEAKMSWAFRNGLLVDVAVPDDAERLSSEAREYTVVFVDDVQAMDDATVEALIARARRPATFLNGQAFTPGAVILGRPQETVRLVRSQAIEQHLIVKGVDNPSLDDAYVAALGALGALAASSTESVVPAPAAPCSELPPPARPPLDDREASIVLTLLGEHRAGTYATGAELARQHGVTERTLYRNMKSLGEVIPLVGERGLGYRLDAAGRLALELPLVDVIGDDETLAARVRDALPAPLKAALAHWSNR